MIENMKIEFQWF